jgi:3-oxoacyl-[acyl-carrier-protein] synthase II
MNARVAITGLGLMTGLGLDLASSWEGLLAGKCPARRFTLFDPAGLPTPFGVELPDGADALFARHVSPRHRRQMTRGTMIAMVASQMALDDAGVEAEGLDRARVGVVVGATGTGYAPRADALDEHRILRNMASAPAAWIGLRGRFEGPSLVVSTACSSGAYALHVAHGLIASGRCDVVVSGAADSSISYLDVRGFSSLMALSEDAARAGAASRPFDRERGGFVLGEGAGMLVLESPGHARRRGARVYAEMPPPGLSTDTYNILSPGPDGASMARAMDLALAAAGIAAGDVGYVNAHGTSTRLNDLYETLAIKKVFGERTRVPVSSTKSMTGHCLSAAAGIEAVISCLALHHGRIPPTANLAVPDPELGLDFVPNVARRADLAHVMSNSFAFGGHNGVCVFSRPEGAR